MKKFLAILLTLAMCFALAACSGGGQQPEPEPEAPDLNAKSEGVMTYEEYAAADIGSEVTIEGYVQAAASWWNDQISVYAQDLTGAYYIEDMACTEEESEGLVPGKLIKVTGTKFERDGEIGISGGTFELAEVDYEYIALPLDVTAILDTDEMIRYQNMYVRFSGMEVTGEPVFKWDGSGENGDDIYFQVGKDDQVFTFMVKSDLTGTGTDVYEGVKKLKAGDIVDLEGFCCWFDGLTPHITSVTMQ